MIDKILTKKFSQPKKVIFFDRDGVINKRPPIGDYVKNWKEFEFLPGVINALKTLQEKNYAIFIITNQAGIGRGIMKEKDLNLIHKMLEEELVKHKVRINGIYYCPHRWDEGCECRKPKPGLLLRAARDFNFDVKKAVFIGDEKRDFLTGKAAGCKTIIVKPNQDISQIINSL